MTQFNQLCVWPGIIVGPDQIKDFEAWMLEHFNIRVQYECEVLTNPDRSENGSPVEGTGGRNDLFFTVHDDDIAQFAVARLEHGIRWWEDVVKYNKGSYLYSQEVLDKYPTRW